MKVLHVIPGLALRYGGPSRAVLDMCRSTNARGIESLIATTDADGRSRLNVCMGEPIDYSGVSVIFFPRQMSERFKYSRPLARWLREHVAEFDLVHVHAVFSHASLAAAAACRNAGRPYIVRPLGSLEPWSLHQNRFAKRALWWLGVRKMLRRAAALHFTSEQERQWVEESLGLEHGVVLPLGIDSASLEIREKPEARNGGPKASRSYVLFLARLHPKKGVELLIDAFGDVVREKQLRHWRLLVAGDGDRRYRTYLEQRIESAGLADRIELVGWVEGNEKASLLSDADLVVLPSFQENFALSVVEAMSVGVPVIVSTKVGIAPEIANAEAGWRVATDRDAWSAALKSALGNGAELARRGRNGVALVRSRFLLDDVAQRLEHIYRDVALGWRGGTSSVKSEDSRTRSRAGSHV